MLNVFRQLACIKTQDTLIKQTVATLQPHLYTHTCELTGNTMTVSQWLWSLCRSGQWSVISTGRQQTSVSDSCTNEPEPDTTLLESMEVSQKRVVKIRNKGSPPRLTSLLGDTNMCSICGSKIVRAACRSGSTRMLVNVHFSSVYTMPLCHFIVIRWEFIDNVKIPKSRLSHTGNTTFNRKSKFLYEICAYQASRKWQTYHLNCSAYVK